MQTKEQIFEDFKVEEIKDLKLSKFKKYKGKEQFVNRIKYLQDHAKAKEAKPNAYNHLSINFKNLIKMYQYPTGPEQYNWDVLGIEPYWMKQKREEDEEREKKSVIKSKKDSSPSGVSSAKNITFN